MDAFMLAAGFKKFVEENWPGKEPDPGDLYSFFEDWADNDDAIALTAGDHGLLLEAFIVIVAQFAANPQDFEPIAHAVTALLNLDSDSHGLPGILDERWWRSRVFRRQFGYE